MLEEERDRAIGTEVAAELGERVAHVGDRADLVVGHAVDDDRGAVDAVALVADLFVVHAVEIAGAAIDGPLDVVGGHVLFLALVDCQPQPRIGRRRRRPPGVRPR